MSTNELAVNVGMVRYVWGMRDPTVTPLFSLHVSLFLSYFCSANSIHVDTPPRPPSPRPISLWKGRD